MNHEDEDILKEIHYKVYTCTLPNKLTMKAMICITMTYENIYATSCEATVVAGNMYIPHTIVEYLGMVDVLSPWKS